MEQKRTAKDVKSDVAFLISKVKKEHKGTDWTGEETCPICGGKVIVKHSKLNGHTFGRCSTIKCVGWME